MNSEAKLVDEVAKQIIFQQFKYQSNTKTGKGYRFCNRSCKAGGNFENGIFSSNDKNHTNHAEMTQIEVDKLLKVKQLKRSAETDHTINVRASITKFYSELASNYPPEELSQVQKRFVRIDNFELDII